MPQRRINLFSSPSGSNSPSTSKYCENVDRRQPKTPSGFVLGDFVSPDVKKRLSSSDKKRRINPTSVELSEPKFGTVVRDLQSSSAFKNAVERIDDNLSEIREGLKSERERIRENASLQPVSKKMTSENNKLQPSLELVTQKEELVKIADKYLNYVNLELVNFGSEFNFLFHLLTSTNGTRMKHFVIDTELLYSAHNCCFLAVTILNSLRNFLTCLNGAALKLLLRTRLIETMNLELVNFLRELHQRKLAPNHVTLLQENVPFSIDNDIISCYANQVDFQAFKRQRDLFYEVYRIWKEDHMKDEWDFGQVLGSRIRGALNRRNGPINGSQFARLFCNQLISSCRNGGSFYGDSSQVDDAELLSLANSTNIAKIRKLQERFFKPTRETGRTSCFLEEEEFFRDFILVSNDAYFLEFLKCRMTKLIIEENSFVPNFGDEDLSSGILEESDRRRFVQSIRTLQLLAKFLGLILFGPFQTDRIPESLVTELMEERSVVLPHWDLVAMLQSSIRRGQVTLTVPWIIEFLAMADPVSVKFPWCKVLLNSLFSLARSDYIKSFSRNPNGTILIRLLVGWLLDQPNIEPPVQINLPEEARSPTALDYLPYVTEEVLEICCPFLASASSCLGQVFAGLRSAAPTQIFRKITPVAAQEARPVKSETDLGAELEEAFLQSQAPSTKRTIDFVSERFASNVVKHLKATEIKIVMEEGLEELAKISKEKDQQQKVNELSVRLSATLKLKSKSSSVKLIWEPALSTMKALLPPETSQHVCEIVATMVQRGAQEKVTAWVELHTSNKYFYKELMEVLEKKALKTCQIKGIADEELLSNTISDHNENCSSPFDIVTSMRDVARDLLNDLVQTSEEFISGLLVEATKVIGQRKEITLTHLQCAWQITFDLLMAVIIVQPTVVTSTLITQFIDYWKLLQKETSLLEHWIIFCPKQMILLAQSFAPRQTWGHLSNLITKLLDVKLVDPSLLESQCVQLLKQDWPPGLMQYFGTCMKDLSEYLVRNEDKLWHRGAEPGTEVESGSEETTAHFLDWISWYCGHSELS